MWPCFPLLQISLMSGLIEVSWILLTEFNLLWHLTLCSVWRAPLHTTERMSERGKWCHDVTIILFTVQTPKRGLWGGGNSVGKGRLSLTPGLRTPSQVLFIMKWNEAQDFNAQRQQKKNCVPLNTLHRARLWGRTSVWQWLV